MESFDSFWDDAANLIEKHWREIAHYPDIPLNPDLDRYRAAERAGSLRIYTCRLEGSIVPRFDPVLVGYAVFFVAPNAHHQSSLQAVGDVIYIDPEFRKGHLGRKLLQYAETELQTAGVECVYHHAKVKHPALGVILNRMGYEMIDVVYGKRLN